MNKFSNILMALCFFSIHTFALEYHVAKNGSDANNGTKESPFLSIQVAAKIAVAGDTITVHEGLYRERVDPKNSGKNELLRITYRATEGEKVIIKGSELITNWKKVEKTVWKAVVPNTIFRNYNPYSDLIMGDWFTPGEVKMHTGDVYINGQSIFEQNSIEEIKKSKENKKFGYEEPCRYTWYAEVNDENTTFYVNFQDLNPNKQLVEINAREACFYPSRPGMDYITISGFEMSQAATQWAAPTAEQPGLIGTHWSKGWIIENNTVSHSKCVGIALGKDRATGHNIWTYNKSKGGATSYNEVIFEALDAGWSKENIGSHIVRNNVIFDCGQAGIVGSLGAVYSEIYGNHIYDIYTKRIFTGAEMAGIKIHASIDMLIKNNRIHNAYMGIWLDWMADGARVTSNILYNNSQHDLFLEVNHGPTLIDNNLFLTEEGISIKNCSEGVAFIHNVFMGKTHSFNTLDRTTPYHNAHSTSVKGVAVIAGGDCRFYNNIYVKTKAINDTVYDFRGNTYNIGYGNNSFDNMRYDSYAGANVYYNGASPYKNEEDYISKSEFKPSFSIEESGNDVFINVNIDDAIQEAKTQMITTKMLGTTIISEVLYENPDATPLKINTDYFGKVRNAYRPMVGPFESLKKGTTKLKVW